MVKASAEVSDNGLSDYHVFDWLVNGDAALWIIDHGRAVAVTRIYDDYGKRVLSIPIVGGIGFHEWIDDLDRMIGNFAKETNCDIIEFYGRHAYLKVGKKFGWKNTHTVMTKEVPK